MIRTREVAIVGGGPAGCATAIALRRLGVDDVLIVEAGQYDRVRLGESIPPDSRTVLERLGVLDGFLAGGHEPCLGSCSAWGDSTLGYNDFMFNPHGHGWHLDRRRFDAFVARAAVEAGAELATGTAVRRIDRSVAAPFELRLAPGAGTRTTVRARFVVDASGRCSYFARAMGARQLFHDRLTCVAGFMQAPSESIPVRLTMLEAVDYGWWYAARLPNHRLAAAVASDPMIVKHEHLHTRAGWLARLAATEHVSRELTGCRIDGGSLVARTAPSFVLDRSAGSDWLAVGDAASSCDPISSQGIHNALHDGLRAAEAVAKRIGGDAGAPGDYQDGVAARFADYLSNRNYFYGLERRWAASPFWVRRRERAEAR